MHATREVPVRVPERRRIRTAAIGLKAVSGFVVTTLVATLLVAVPEPAAAWSPPTHILGVAQAMREAQSGSVTIPRADGASSVTVPVNPTIAQALAAYPAAFNAGAIGPDAFPDTYFGQLAIHPDTRTHNDTEPESNEGSRSHEWFDYLWEQAWDPATPQPERLKNIAFALGYMAGHANGDTWAHTWVNKWAEGVAPPWSQLEHADIAVRHLVVEAYVDKHRPGWESKAGFPVDAPTKFIADKLIRSDFARDKGEHKFWDEFLGMQDALKTKEAEVHEDSTSQDFVGDCPLCFPDPTDSPFNVIELVLDVLIELYLDEWIAAIDRGIDSWPAVWQTIAQQFFSGRSTDAGVILNALKDWFFDNFFAMMGVPTFLLEDGIVEQLIDYALELVATVLGFVFDVLAAVPVLGDLIRAIQRVYGKAKDAVIAELVDYVDREVGTFITEPLRTSELDQGVKDILDHDQDGIIKPSEIIRIFAHPEDYVDHPSLFPDGSRDDIDSEIGLPAACVDDDVNDVFCDYSLTDFAPLYDTGILGKLSMLDENGLNTFFRRAAGAGAATLGDLYGPHTNASADWDVPNNAMLGWAKSLDADHQWRANSMRDNRSYGMGTMWLWEDCVSRDKVFRPTFKQPVRGVDAFSDAGDPPTGITDSQPPASSLSLSGPNVTSQGQTFVSGETDIAITSIDNYFGKPDIRVSLRAFPSSNAAPAYGPAVPADPAPFRLEGSDGPQTVQFFGTDGSGTCNSEGEQSRAFTLDNTPPVITVLSPVPPKSQYVSDAMLPLDFMATDGPGSGVDDATKRHFADGVEKTPVPTAIDLFDYPALTPHVYRAEVADLLGNVGRTEVPWETVVTHSSLQNNLDKAYLIRGCVTKDSTYHSLSVKLRVAEQSDARGNDGASDKQLESFKEEVAAQTGRTVTAYCANILTLNATALQAA